MVALVGLLGLICLVGLVVWLVWLVFDRSTLSNFDRGQSVGPLADIVKHGVPEDQLALDYIKRMRDHVPVANTTKDNRVGE